MTQEEAVKPVIGQSPSTRLLGIIAVVCVMALPVVAHEAHAMQAEAYRVSIDNLLQQLPESGPGHFLASEALVDFALKTGVPITLNKDGEIDIPSAIAGVDQNVASIKAWHISIDASQKLQALKNLRRRLEKDALRTAQDTHPTDLRCEI